MEEFAVAGIERSFDRVGGMFAPLAIAHEGRTIQPLRRAPHLAALAGDFFRAPLDGDFFARQ